MATSVETIAWAVLETGSVPLASEFLGVPEKQIYRQLSEHYDKPNRHWSWYGYLKNLT